MSGPAPVPDGSGHVPVMVAEVVEVFRPVPPGLIVDATVGAGGHAGSLLEARADVSLLGIDRDEQALSSASAAIARYGDRATLAHARFDTLADVARAHGHDRASGVLFDLGVSSLQLDQGERGFSFRSDGPLDMRMDRSRGQTAADVVNGYTWQELAELIARYGGERHAGRIARAVVAARPISSTGELAEVVRNAIPAPARRRGGDPARRTFQAIRIEVNDELAVIPRALEAALALVVPGGRVAALAYHSGEDRLVKDAFARAASGGCTCPPRLPCTCGAAPEVRLLWRGARKPTADEVDANRRAQSARLRAVEKLRRDQ